MTIAKHPDEIRWLAYWKAIIYISSHFKINRSLMNGGRPIKRPLLKTTFAFQMNEILCVDCLSSSVLHIPNVRDSYKYTDFRAVEQHFGRFPNVLLDHSFLSLTSLRPTLCHLMSQIITITMTWRLYDIRSINFWHHFKYCTNR